MTGQVEHIVTNKLQINPRNPRTHSALRAGLSGEGKYCASLIWRASRRSISSAMTLTIPTIAIPPPTRSRSRATFTLVLAQCSTRTQAIRC
jgi:hypothetical protein